MAWTDQMVEDLKIMWQQGLTTAEIGKRLGVSKNSIVGKVHRLGLSGRPSPIKKKEDKSSTPVENKKTAPEKKAKSEKSEVIKTAKEPAKIKESSKNNENVKIEITAAPVKPVIKEEAKIKECQKSDFDKSGRAVSLTELDNHTCRWPIGDPKDENFHFCGRKVRIGQTYCDEHSLIAYVKTGKTK